MIKRICFLFLGFASVAAFAQDIPPVYRQLENLYNQGDYQSCIKMIPEVEAFTQQRKDTLASNSFFYLGDSFNQLGQANEAINWWERDKNLLRELGREDEYSILLYNLAFLYLNTGKYALAAQYADEQLTVDGKLFGTSSDDFVTSVLSACDIYLQVDRALNAESKLQTALRDQNKSSHNKGLLLNKEGAVLTYQGKYSKAFRSLSNAARFLKNDTTTLQQVTANLGILFMEQGKYAEAEECYERVLSSLTAQDAKYIPSLNNFALIEQRLGQYGRAEKLLKQIQETEAQTLGTSHPSYAVTLSNLALVYNDEARYPEAEATMQQALTIQQQNKDENTSSYARKLNNLAKIKMSSNAFDQAIPLYEQSLKLFLQTIGEQTAEYATCTFNLALAYWRSGKKELALTYLNNAISIRKKILGRRHPKYAESLQKLAEYQWEKKQRKEANQTLGEVFENYYYQIESIFPALTEEEKAQFYYGTLKPSFEKFNSFTLEYYTQEPSILDEAYNHQINTKAVIMRATEKVKQGIDQSKDTVLIKRFENWQNLKEQIAKLYAQNQLPAKTDSLAAIADREEKYLAQKSSAFSRAFLSKRFTWQQVQKKLKPNEAAIEVVRIKKYTPEAGGKFLDDLLYAFLIVTYQTKTHPDLIVLKNGAYLEGKFLRFLKNNIQFNAEDPFSYKHYFESLDVYLKKGNIKKIYLSPDGVYNKINLNTIRNPATQKFMMDEYDIQLVTNTRDLVDGFRSKTNDQSSILMGFPSFNISGQKKIDTLNTRGLTRGLNRSLRGGLLRYVNAYRGIAPLPGTKKEIDGINKLFATQKPEVWIEKDASEEKIKSLTSPRILHLATHGYFLEDETSGTESRYISNPLLRSGLILAGAENFLKTGVTIDSMGNDGVITAYEAMNLDLGNTDLVVLSACETGLGEIKNGEGVYGLQRAFALSGAGSLIMSLWNVDDEATQKLMLYFYEELLKTNDAHDALKKAQLKLKEKFPSPFYWGAFVQIGF